MKTEIITGIRVEIEPDYGVVRYAHTHEQRRRALEGWASDFEDFVRDHRSQDPVSLNVITDTEEVCSFCKSTWETSMDTGDADAPFGMPVCCTPAIQEWEQSLNPTEATK